MNIILIILNLTKRLSWDNLFMTEHYRRVLLLVVTSTFLFSGCASYLPIALTHNANLATSMALLPTAGKARDFCPVVGLSLTEVAIFAVNNNAYLNVQRKRLGVAGAQLYSAKLFPDPHLSVGLDHPSTGMPNLVNAFASGLSYSIIPLINRGARIERKEEALHQVNLELIWMEWQVSQHARSLAVRWVSEQDRLLLLYKMRELYAHRYQRSAEALKQGDLTLDVNGTDLTALLNTFTLINKLQQTHNTTTHALCILLNLAPDYPLSIAAPGSPALVTKEQFLGQLAVLAKQRPDLLALQAGYRSQEAKVRAAILSQFPSLSVGISRARDSDSLYSNSFNIGINLPLFSGNRGVIAIQRATRERLRAEYQTRLNQATVTANKLFCFQGIVADQQRQLNEYLPALEQFVLRARKAYRRGDIRALTVLNMETTWITRSLEVISLNQKQWENHIALQTLLAMPGADGLRKLSGTENKQIEGDKQ